MSQLTLITNAHIHAPEDLGTGHLLIGGGRILQVLDQPPELPSSLDVEVCDIQGARIIPCIIDGHAHVTGGGGESGFSSRVPPVAVGRFAQSGVTSVIGLLGTDDIVRSTASLLAATRGLREQGLSAWCYTGGYHLPPTTLTGSVRGDMVHIGPIIGAGEVAISDHRSSQPSLDELLRLASEVHVAGLMTGKAGIIHLHLGDGERGLDLVREALAASELPARVFNPTHINRRKTLFEEACDLASRGCHVDLTAFPVGPEEDAWSAEDGLQRYLDGGGPPDRITVSSDGGGCLPEFDEHGRICAMDVGDPSALAACLKSLVDSGMSLAEALPAFTRNPASLLRLQGKGRIGEGLDADLVVLDDACKVDSVMARGQWHRYRGKPLMAGLFEDPSNYE